MVYTFTYTDCANHTHAWTYTYTINAPDFVLPADGASTVNCPADAVAPTPPVVTDACGNAITPVVTTPTPVACNGTMVYTFTYTDCANHTHAWTYTYTSNTHLTLPTTNLVSISMIAAASETPTPPVVTDACGNAITPVVTTPTPVTCNGAMVYTFTYTDCANHTHAWTYTYT